MSTGKENRIGITAHVLLCACIVFCGCQSSETGDPFESEYDRVSAEIEQLKARSEAAADIGDNIRVDINMLTTSKTESFVVDSMLQYIDRNVVAAKRPEVYARSGLSIGVAGDGFTARLDIVRQSLRSAEDSRLFLVLADGASGYINVGREISVPRFYYFGRYFTTAGYEFRRAGRSLEVTVRRLGQDAIELDLVPVFSDFLSDGGDMELTELSTTVRVRPGQVLVIGGGDTSSEDVASALLSYTKGGEQKRTLITVIATAK
jgi:hypothetical protein